MVAELLQTLWHATLALTAALVLVLLVRVPLRRIGGAACLRWLWSAAVLLPAATLLPAPMLAPAVVQLVSLDVADAVASGGEAVRATAPTPSHLATLVLALWFAGACTSAIAAMRQQRRFVRELGDLAPQDDGTWRAASSSGTPALLGVIAPRIVLPADAEQRFSAQERDLVLAHERAHRAAGDTRLAAAAAAVRCLFWFHPLVHVAARCLRLDQEYACDAAVLAAHPLRRRTYAEALLKAQSGPLLPLGCQWDAGRPLLARVRQLGAALPSPMRRASALVGVAAMVAAGTGTVWAMQPARLASGDGAWIEARIELRPPTISGAGPAAAPAPARVVVRDGESFLVRVARAGEDWELIGTAWLQADGRIRTDLLLVGGGAVRTSDETLAAGVPFFMHRAAGDDTADASATITLWPAAAPAPLPEGGDVARATGRVRVSVDDKHQARVFDGSIGGASSLSVPGADDLVVHHELADLTPTHATMAFRVERRSADGTTLLLSTPAIVIERGSDGFLRLDIPVAGAPADAQYWRLGADSPPPPSHRQIEVEFTVDPA